MSRPGYIIVEGNSLDELRGHVNSAIMNGYRPIGGVTKIRDESGSGWVARACYVQAMVLPGCVP